MGQGHPRFGSFILAMEWDGFVNLKLNAGSGPDPAGGAQVCRHLLGGLEKTM